MKGEASLSRVRAVERAMAILREFGPSATRLTLADLTRRTGFDKSTTRRLLQTLAVAEFIEFDDISKSYALGPGILLLVPGVHFGSDLRTISAPVLTRLAERTGATSFVWTYHRGYAMCLDRVKGPDFHIDTPWSAIGTRVSLNCAGGPRVVFAHLPPDERAQVLRGPLPRHTEYTQTEPRALEAAAAEIRERGWEFAVDDYTVGLSGLGAPVLDPAGALVASVSITTLTPQFAMKDGKPCHLAAVLEAAREIRARLKF